MNTDLIIIRRFIQEHGREAARTLEKLDPEKLAPFFDITSTELLLGVVPSMNPHLLSKVFEKMKQDQVIKLFESLDIQFVVLVVSMLNHNLSEIILNGLSPGKSTAVRRMIHYLENSVGGHMDPTVLTLSEGMTIQEALAETRRYKEKIQPDLFVLTPERKIKGAVNLSELITHDPQMEISRIMHTGISTIPPETPIESILHHPAWAEYYALPVVDKTSLFLGAIRLETIRSILLKSGRKVEESNQTVINALGELYQIGLSGLIKSATDFKSVQTENS
jgi:magnesium transporter